MVDLKQSRKYQVGDLVRVREDSGLDDAGTVYKVHSVWQGDGVTSYVCDYPNTDARFDPEGNDGLPVLYEGELDPASVQERALSLLKRIPQFAHWSDMYVDFESWEAIENGVEYGWRITVQVFPETLYPVQVYGVLIAIPEDPDWQDGVIPIGRGMAHDSGLLPEPSPGAMDQIMASARAFLRDLPAKLVQQGDFYDLFAEEMVF